MVLNKLWKSVTTNRNTFDQRFEKAAHSFSKMRYNRRYQMQWHFSNIFVAFINFVIYSDSKDDLTDKIDFIVCLGGDGTLLYASLLFQQSVPPVMAFHLGSLGFLTPFKFANFQEQVTAVLEGRLTYDVL